MSKRPHFPSGVQPQSCRTQVNTASQLEYEFGRPSLPLSTQDGPPPACLPTAASSSRNKAAGLNRGRVSDFAPAPLAVDEFDVHLDRQAAASLSHASADLIDNITDLTVGSGPFPVFDPIVFPSGSYEIILFLDNREVKAKNDRDYIYKELLNEGVNVEQRSLALGDVLWVARRKCPIPDAVNNECILDFILERKRMDDLCQSIKNGRFHEQKFRLTETGLKVFYLVEDYETAKHKEYFGVQIDTARSSTQVVDGFILKETRKLSYTISYLATMHQTIASLYEGRPLYIIPPHLVKRHSYASFQRHLRQIQPDTPCVTSYQCFERLFGKSANLTSRDLLAQMLLCVKGLSPEKAATIIEVYPTMRSLWEAFGVKKTRVKIPEAKAMLCRIEGERRQKIGPVLSEKIYNLLRRKNYTEDSDGD
ncbi:restriction endonuclease type II-like protein [Hysterangium stoloniferum]|nr:restriction endonuclease type II-like protein [Hysterangium stoloniferum]